MSEEQTSGLLLPTDPDARQKIKMAIKEISNSKTRIEAEKDNIKSIIEAISEEHELPKPAINKVATWYHKQSLGADISQVENSQSLYETLFDANEEE